MECFGRHQYHGKIFAKVELPGIIVSAGERAAGTSVPLHTHELPTIRTLLSGDHTFERYDGSIGKSRVGVWYLDPADRPHRHLSCPTPIRSMAVIFEPEVLQLSPPTTLMVLEGGHYMGLAMRIFHELVKPDRFSPIVMEGMCKELIGTLYRHGSSIENENIPFWLDTARSLIHENFSGHVALEKVAATVGVHPSHLSKAFRIRFGETFTEYLMSLRLAFAKERICSSEDKIAMIAAECGFADHAHLTRSFRTKYGLSPTEARKLKVGEGTISPFPQHVA